MTSNDMKQQRTTLKGGEWEREEGNGKDKERCKRLGRVCEIGV